MRRADAARTSPSLVAALVTALVSALLVGCASAAAGPGAEAAPTEHVTAEPTASATTTPRTTIRIASLKGPTTMGLVGLMAEAGEGLATHDYQVTMYGSPDELVPLLVQGEVDVALLPANLAAVLHARTAADGPQIQVAAINTLGMLEVLETGDTIHSIADLEGRTLYSTGKGTTPEHVLNHLLVSNGLVPGTDVTVEFASEATEVAARLAADPTAVGILPQPYVTVLKAQSPGVRTALSLTEEWSAVTPGSELVTGVVVVRTDFAEANKAAVDEFLTDYEASTERTNDRPAESAVLIAEAGIVPAAAIAEAAIPSCNITYIEGAELETILGGYLEVLFEADPASVGGSLPGDDFYYRR